MKEGWVAKIRKQEERNGRMHICSINLLKTWTTLNLGLNPWWLKTPWRKSLNEEEYNIRRGILIRRQLDSPSIGMQEFWENGYGQMRRISVW